MMCVETLAKVRRDHFVHGKGIKQIGRERGLSRNSVRKILRTGETAFSYERPSQPLPKLGAFVDRLETMLEANEKRPKRDRFRLTRIFDDLRREGFEGGYDSVRRHAKRWRQTRTTGVAQAFVPLSFAPGEAYQFDWSHEFVVMGGATTKVKVAHVRLCHSRMRLLIASPRETRGRWCLTPTTEPSPSSAGPVPEASTTSSHRPPSVRGRWRGSTAVDAILVGKERRFNRRFERMCSHHLVEPVACTPAAGWEKGQVESQVKTSRERIFTPRLRVADYDELNAVARASARSPTPPRRLIPR